MEKELKLTKVALTINNVCNLNCPHCYLQYLPPELNDNSISDEVIEKVFAINGLELVVIAGMEPFYNKNSVQLLERIASHFFSKGVKVNVVTNGLNLNLITDKLIETLSVIDISLDGGSKTYQGYREGSFNKLVANIAYLKERNFKGAINCLNVISAETVDAIDDMIEADMFFNFKKIYFSPYIKTINDGKNTVHNSSIESILLKLKQNKLFMENDKCIMFFGVNHVVTDVSKKEELLHRNDWITSFIQQNFQEEKVLYAAESLKQGFLRITYDGLLLDPYHALHPSLYKKFGKSIFGIAPEEFYKDCVKVRDLEHWAVDGPSRIFPLNFVH